MTVRAGVRVNLRALDELSDRWSEAIEWIQSDRGGAERVALQGAQILVGRTREAILDSASGRSLPGQRTGALARSFRERVRVTRSGIEMEAKSKLVYARIQDEGGRIFAKKRMLAIPMTSVAVRKWPRDWPRGQLFRPRGKSYLAEATGNGKIKVHYLLRASVRIRPKNYTEKARERAVPEIARLFVRSLAKEVVR